MSMHIARGKVEAVVLGESLIFWYFLRMDLKAKVRSQYSFNLCASKNISALESEGVHCPKMSIQASILSQTVQCIEQVWGQEHTPSAILTSKRPEVKYFVLVEETIKVITLAMLFSLSIWTMASEKCSKSRGKWNNGVKKLRNCESLTVQVVKHQV